MQSARFVEFGVNEKTQVHRSLSRFRFLSGLADFPINRIAEIDPSRLARSELAGRLTVRLVRRIRVQLS
jgi:hypothetical protein